MAAHPSVDAFAATRRQTLELVAGLSQERSEERRRRGQWSPGEVLHHLLRVDLVLLPDVEELVRRWRRCRRPVQLHRGLADFGIRVPGLPKAAQALFLELPVAVAGVLLPTAVRRVATRPRWVPTKAPPQIAPRFGQPLARMRTQLTERPRLLAERLAEIGADRLVELRYSNPLVGRTDVPGLLQFLASHEGRHQEQLRDLLAEGAPVGSRDE